MLLAPAAAVWLLLLLLLKLPALRCGVGVVEASSSGAG
jgi:hypothetical protein